MKKYYLVAKVLVVQKNLEVMEQKDDVWVNLVV